MNEYNGDFNMISSRRNIRKEKEEIPIYYSVEYDSDLNTILLKEHIDGLKKEIISVIARNTGWRAQLIIDSYLTTCSLGNNGIKKIGGSRIQMDPINASRLFVLQKVISAIHDEKEAKIMLNNVLNLPEGEIVFWAWKIALSNKRAIHAFKILNGEKEDF